MIILLFRHVLEHVTKKSLETWDKWNKEIYTRMTWNDELIEVGTDKCDEAAMLDGSNAD